MPVPVRVRLSAPLRLSRIRLSHFCIQWRMCRCSRALCARVLYTMISFLVGTVRSIGEQTLVLDVGPVGLQIFVVNTAALNVGQHAAFVTYLHWNQEQGPSLFGFENEHERTAFILAIGCSGIGPKVALAILAHLGWRGFVGAVSKSDIAALARVSGIGPKKAEHIVVHLRHKIEKFAHEALAGDDGAGVPLGELSEALTSLGYTRAEIAHVIRELTSAKTMPGSSFDQLLRRALALLSQRTRA